MTVNIKTNFVEIHKLLVENKSKKVSSIMDQLLEIMESKQRDKNHKTDEHGLWVFCYYHKEWELVTQVEYGKKANTVTGLNTMCKVGTNQWTKQQRDFKSARAALLDDVANGSLEIADVQDKIDELEEARVAIKPLWESHEEIAYLDPRQQVEDDE